MALKHLRIDEMVEITSTWVKKGHRDRATLSGHPSLAVLLPELDSAHYELVYAQPKEWIVGKLSADGATLGSTRSGDYHGANSPAAIWIRVVNRIRSAARVLVVGDTQLKSLLTRVHAAESRALDRAARAGTASHPRHTGRISAVHAAPKPRIAL